MKLKKIVIIIIAFFILMLFTNKSKAMTIVLDPGHGGADTGAIANDKVTYERDVNLKIANYLKQYLEKYDVTIYLTHNGLKSGELDIYDRAMIARNKKADLFVSLHINSSPSGSAVGAEAFVTANKSLPKYNEETTKLGNKVLKNLEKLGIKNRGVQTKLITKDKSDVYSDGTTADYYGVIRYAMRGTKIDYGVVKPKGAVSANIKNGEGVPTLLIEHCFINSSDFKYMDSDDDIQKLAYADGDAIIEHYKLQKKQNTTINKINEKDIITIHNLKVKDANLTRISEKTKDQDFLKNIEVSKNLKVELENTKNNIITTGTKVLIKNNNNNLYTYNCIIYGDINQDGKITSADYVLIKNHIMTDKKISTDILKEAADVSRDSKISSADYVLIKNHIMKGTNLKTE